MKRETRRVRNYDLQQQVREVFGTGAKVHVWGLSERITVAFTKRRGESLEDLKRRLVERLDQPPPEGA